MNFFQIIRYPFYRLGLLKKPVDSGLGVLPPDISGDKNFLAIYQKVKPFTMVDIERCYSLYESVKYILKNDLKGDFVECGVWKGGSCMLIAYTLLAAGVSDRVIWLYDTYTGMSRPGEHDGDKEKIEWEKHRVNEDMNNWCLASLEEAEWNMKNTGYPVQNLRFIKGRVEETIPGEMPGMACLIRLDTDWYASTKHELEHLYPLLVNGGVLIIDDYGVWQGSKRATDEFFKNRVYLHRIDWSARLIIK